MFESDKPKKVAIDTRLKKWALKPRKPLISQGFSGGLYFSQPMLAPQSFFEPHTLLSGENDFSQNPFVNNDYNPKQHKLSMDLSAL